MDYLIRHYCPLHPAPTCPDAHSLQHSPSGRCETEGRCEVLNLHGRESLCEDVSGLVISWAVDELNRASLNGVADKMVAYVDMLHLSMVQAILGEHDCGLVVAMEGGGLGERAKDLTDEVSQPDSLLCSVHGSNVL